MCGILGILRFDGAPANLPPAALGAIRHRGPDGEGLYHDRSLALGQTRLAVIDLSEQAKQPLRSQDGRYAIVNDGTIYNHPELCSRLEAVDARFTTGSETEVILEAYRYWGRDCVKHFRGMFAFAIWDTLEQTLFLARDRCGERPLIYYRDAELFIFASEIKALVPLLPLLPVLDPSVVDMYLHYQYTPEPFTLLQGARKLPAAHTMTINVDRPNAEPQRFWCVEDTPDIIGLPTDTQGILRRIREALEESVKLSLRADAPVAVGLSGGIDSGALAALAQKNYPEPIHAISVGYPGRPPYDEREQARELAEKLGMIFHEVELPVDRFLDFFPELVRIMDEPIADPAAFAHYTVPKAARDLGIKALLSGIGGDELFWGYEWVARAARINQDPAPRRRWNVLRGILPDKIYRRIFTVGVEDLTTPKGFFHFYDLTPDFAYARNLLPAIYGPAMCDLPYLNAYQPVDIGTRTQEQIPAAVTRLLFDTWLIGNCLNLGDRVGMSIGVETRLPFLDYNFIELVMALRRRTPDHHLGQKAWLRAALKGILPDEALTRPKRGFQPPVQEWLGGVVRRYVNIMPDGELSRSGIIASSSETALYGDSDDFDWPRLFMSYKFVLLEMWMQQLRRST